MSSPMRIAIVGAGGLASEVHWVLRSCDPNAERFTFVGYAVTDARYVGIGPDGHETLLIDDLASKADGAVIGIGDPGARSAIAGRLTDVAPELVFPSLVHPSVQLDHRSATIGPGAILCAGAVGTVNITLGAHAYVNLCVTLGHGAVVGASSVVNPGCNISGDVTIGERVLVGTGARILEKITIHDDAVVGGGAVVVKDVAAGTTVVGIPAKPLAPRTP